MGRYRRSLTGKDVANYGVSPTGVSLPGVSLPGVSLPAVVFPVVPTGVSLPAVVFPVVLSLAAAAGVAGVDSPASVSIFPSVGAGSGAGALGGWQPIEKVIKAAAMVVRKSRVTVFIVIFPKSARRWDLFWAGP